MTTFNLIGGRCYSRFVNNALEVFRQEIRYPDCFYQAELLGIHECLPCLVIFTLLRQRPMDEIFIKIIKTQAVQ